MEQTLTPIYPTTEGLTQQRLRQLSQQALAMLGPSSLPDWLPAEAGPRLTNSARSTRRSATCIRPPPDCRHRGDSPKAGTGRSCAWPSKKLLTHQLSLAAPARSRAFAGSAALPPASRLADSSSLPILGFQPTGAQQRVGAEIAYDLAQDEPMLRLVQGDVGAGKTVVAALACPASHTRPVTRWR
ncbi:ATP-dependent DNA helicase RecG [Pseudomonas aeruginosa]|nr:ATP-dependent DNA helicase RecG [Pseudomonas aeruginosa]